MTQHADHDHGTHAKQAARQSLEPANEGAATTPAGNLDRLFDTIFHRGDISARRGCGPTTASFDILSHVTAAELDLSLLQTLSADVLQKAQNKSLSADEVVKSAQRITSPLASATQHLQFALTTAGRELLARQQSKHLPMSQIIEEMGAEPGMRDVVERVTLQAAHFLSNMDGAADARSEVRPFLQGDAGMVVSDLRHLRANLGLSSMGHDELVRLVELRVSISVVDLQTGNPMNYIQDAVGTTAAAWNLSIGNFSAAVTRLVETISHEELKKADLGLMQKLFEEGKKLILQAAEFVTGSNVGAKLGFIAIEKLLAYQERLEQSRIRDDKATFVANLQRLENALRMEGVKDGGNLDINRAVREIDREFLRIGEENPQDAYKLGDRVVFGAQAKYISDLQARTDAYRSTVPSVDEFTTRFFVEWINANHKQRVNSALRSPFEGPTHLDGYIAVDFTVDFSSASGFLLYEPGAAHIHCPNSSDVAAALKGANPDFDLSKLDTSVHVNVALTDKARAALPTSWDSGWHEWHVHLGPEHISSDVESTRRKWNWLQKTLGTSAAELLARVKDLKGS